MSEKILVTSGSTWHPLTHTHFTGAIIGLYGDVLQGWSLNGLKPEERQLVEVYIDGACDSLVTADQFHHDPEASD
ncbi:hypothetical protein, partial [Pseudomonas syringae group genomosp. 7]|uniref:hypothetical protein n=1 Tax=Pseudomonas syringae group genomosp. 7 TaxID=251699 RepID=UPI0037702499